MFKLVLILHIVAGLFGLIIGPIAMRSKKRKGLHTVSGKIYSILMIAVCISAAFLSILNWEKSWWLLLVAIFSFSFCLKGLVAARNRKPGWVKPHISGMLGSYIAMTTAFIVTNVGRVEFLNSIPTIVFWIAPTVIALPLIRKTVAKNF